MRRIVLFALAAVSASAFSQSGFALQNGDRVVFYGDSITDNGPYTTYVEQFIACRYPNLKVTFMNAGVGGDRVTGGWMGPIDQRMTRDLFSRNPTVITSMLGMNDASYRAMDAGIFDTYKTGYQHMMDRIAKEAPMAKVWLIDPSPYDDVTQAVGFPGGYNSVLVQYGEYVKGLAAKSGAKVIDLNTPVNAMLANAKAIDAEKAKKIIPDRVHPTWSGHMVMADAVLRSWNASPLVSKTEIDATTGKGTVLNGSYDGWDNYTFKVTEKALPWYIARGDELAGLVLKSAPIDNDLNQEMLIVKNLETGPYLLKIDGTTIGGFSSAQFAAGINLALYDTPQNRQALKVSDLTNKIVDFRYNRWRNFEFGLQGMPSKDRDDAIKAINGLVSALEAERMKVAQPVQHTYQILKPV